MTINECTNISDLMALWKNKPACQVVYPDGQVEICKIIDHQRDFFISDGIIDEDSWNATSRDKRILFVLREAYEDDHTKDVWNLSDELKYSGPWSSIWRRVSEWTYGLLNTTQTGLARYVSLSHEKGNELLRKVSVMNIKKSDGQHSSSYEEILAYAQHDSAEIIREIELIDPSVVVCGATLESINCITGNKIKEKKNDNWFYFSDAVGDRERLFIDYYHPANRYPALLNYYGITGIYQQALISKG